MKQTTESVLEVNLSVLYTADYCGGAYPPDHVLKSMKEERPFKSKTIFITAKDTSAPVELKTDENGLLLSTSLEIGQYAIFLPEKYYEMSDLPGVSKEFCASWKKIPNGEFSVQEGSKDIKVTVHQTCSPCEPPRP